MSDGKHTAVPVGGWGVYVDGVRVRVRGMGCGVGTTGGWLGSGVASGYSSNSNAPEVPS